MSELKIEKMIIGSVSTNTYYIYDDSKNAVIIDPAIDGKDIYNKLLSKGIMIKGILLTHGHFDHIMGVNELREKAAVKVYALDEEKDVLENATVNESEYIGCPCTVKPDCYVHDGDEIDIEGIRCTVIHTPGHTKGSCCFYFEDNKILISGDTLFRLSVGRTDLPTGSGGALMRSIKEKLFVLPDDVKVYPGHGDSTEIGDEKMGNPFFGCNYDVTII